jgi:asparagine synthase (glutamine-hydrolysing)
MCGIAVAINWPEAETVVGRLIGGILHRGDISDPILRPNPDTAMATRRLRIVDADNAVQPQLSFDGQLAVSFNGEIYNHEDLRVELMGIGVPFRTESDTELSNGSTACTPSSRSILRPENFSPRATRSVSSRSMSSRPGRASSSARR